MIKFDDQQQNAFSSIMPEHEYNLSMIRRHGPDRGDNLRMPYELYRNLEMKKKMREMPTSYWQEKIGRGDPISEYELSLHAGIPPYLQRYVLNNDITIDEARMIVESDESMGGANGSKYLMNQDTYMPSDKNMPVIPYASPVRSQMAEGATNIGRKPDSGLAGFMSIFK